MHAKLAGKLQTKITNLINPLKCMLIAEPLTWARPPLAKHQHLGLLNADLHPGGNTKSRGGIYKPLQAFWCVSKQYKIISITKIRHTAPVAKNRPLVRALSNQVTMQSIGKEAKQPRFGLNRCIMNLDPMIYCLMARALLNRDLEGGMDVDRTA